MNSLIRTALSGFILFIGIASAQNNAASTPQEYELVILNTNDHHGAIDFPEYQNSNSGSLASVSTMISQVRESCKNVLLLDAEDINTGSAVSNMFDAEPDIRAYNAMKYDAVTFGNHEFDGDLKKLKKQIDISDFQWISCNVMLKNKFLGKPYIIKKFKGFTVGIIGLTTARTAAIANHGKEITFTDEIESVASAVKTLRSKKNVDIVILLCHAGDIRQDSKHVTSIDIANKTSGIDLIVDGHSHSYFSKPKIVNNTPIVTAGAYSKYVGKGVMKISNGTVCGFNWKPVEINSETFPPDPKITALLAPYLSKAEKSLNDIVFKNSQKLEFGNSLVRYQEMPSGNILADAMVYEISKLGIVADFAIVNGGNIRTSLPEGSVRRKDVLTMLPFTNSIFVIKLKGSDVQSLFSFIGSIKQGSGAWAQVSDGVKYTITYDNNGNGEISSLTINYKKIAPEKEYIIAVNEFMANGNDGYDVLKKAIYSYNTSVLLSDAFINFMSTLDLAAAGSNKKRITVIGGINPDQNDTFSNTILKTEAAFDEHSTTSNNR